MDYYRILPVLLTAKTVPMSSGLVATYGDALKGCLLLEEIRERNGQWGRFVITTTGAWWQALTCGLMWENEIRAKKQRARLKSIAATAGVAKVLIDGTGETTAIGTSEPNIRVVWVAAGTSSIMIAIDMLGHKGALGDAYALCDVRTGVGDVAAATKCAVGCACNRCSKFEDDDTKGLTKYIEYFGPRQTNAYKEGECYVRAFVVTTAAVCDTFPRVKDIIGTAGEIGPVNWHVMVTNVKGRLYHVLPPLRYETGKLLPLWKLDPEDRVGGLLSGIDWSPVTEISFACVLPDVWVAMTGGIKVDLDSIEVIPGKAIGKELTSVILGKEEQQGIFVTIPVYLVPKDGIVNVALGCTSTMGILGAILVTRNEQGETYGILPVNNRMVTYSDHVSDDECKFIILVYSIMDGKARCRNTRDVARAIVVTRCMEGMSKL